MKQGFLAQGSEDLHNFWAVLGALFSCALSLGKLANERAKFSNYGVGSKGFVRTLGVNVPQKGVGKGVGHSHSFPITFW